MWLRIWLPVQFQNTKPFLATAGVNSKFSAAFTSSLQIFTDVISLKEKQMECIWRITYLEEDVFDVFPTGLDKRHDSEGDKIVSPHWVVVVSPLQYTRKQQVENPEHSLENWISVLVLREYFFKESTWRLTRRNCFFFFLSPVSIAGRKFGPTLLITSDKIKDLKVYRFSLSQ